MGPIDRSNFILFSFWLESMFDREEGLDLPTKKQKKKIGRGEGFVGPHP